MRRLLVSGVIALSAVALGSWVDEQPARHGAVFDVVETGRAAGWRLDPFEMKSGVVLGLFSQERGFDYEPRLREIRQLGAEWVELLVVYFQDGRSSTCIERDAVKTPTEAELARVIRTARELGLHVLVLPVINLRSATDRDWRGNIEPESVEDWFESYRSILMTLADTCEREGAEALGIGSELCSMERHEVNWRGLVTDVRARYGGLVTYSANWDHYEGARFFEALDFVGLSAYFSLTKSLDPTLGDLVRAWRPIVERLETWQAAQGQPLVFLEIGYPSVDGGNTNPWDYRIKGAIDPAEQALCFEALRRVFVGRPLLSGLFAYDWWERGGPEDRTYTPRGKPAEGVLRELLAELQGRRVRRN